MVTSELLKDDEFSYVADPFVVKSENTFYCFHEFYWMQGGAGGYGKSNIHYSTSPDGLTWAYGAKIMEAPAGEAGISYPYVFMVDGEWWMVPCITYDGRNYPIELWKSYSFPTGWAKYLKILTPDCDLRDCTPFQFGGHWYLLGGDKTNKALRLYHSMYLYGEEFTEHPASPLQSGLDKFRPGGRPIIRDGAVDVMIQNGLVTYGHQTRCFRLTDLSPTTCTITEIDSSPLLTASGSGWNADGMHTLDRIDSGLSIVDGKVNNPEIYGIGVYRDVVS